MTLFGGVCVSFGYIFVYTSTYPCDPCHASFANDLGQLQEIRVFYL